MSALRDIWVDLVDKKLWPVAVVLVAALVAVPVVLSKPAPKKTSDSAAPAANTARLPVPVAGSVSLAEAGGGVVTGKPKDPFGQQHLPKPPPTSTVETKSSSDSGTSSDSKGNSSQDVGVQTQEQKAATPTYQVVVRYGVSGTGRPKKELDSLTALPSSANPLFVYLGDVNGHRTAVFLVSSDAVPTGDGRCAPTKKICSQVYLDAGQTEYFDVTTGRGVVQYQLDVLGIVKR